MQADSAAEVVARLNAKCHTWNITGGIPNYTSSDIAAAIGMMQNEVERLFVRVIYAKQHQFLPDLESSLLSKTDHLFPTQRFQHPHIKRKWINTVLTECLYQSLCITCKGEGKRVLQMGSIAVCVECGGSGYRPFSDYARANSLGLHRELMRRHYRKVYESILSVVREINNQAKWNLAKTLQF